MDLVLDLKLSQKLIGGGGLSTTGQKRNLDGVRYFQITDNTDIYFYIIHIYILEKHISIYLYIPKRTKEFSWQCYLSLHIIFNKKCIFYSTIENKVRVTINLGIRHM